MRPAILACLLVACAHQSVTVRPDALVRHRAELESRGFARVEVEQGGSVVVHNDAEVTATLPGNEHSYLWGLVKTGAPDRTTRLTVEELVDGCDLASHASNCLAGRIRQDPLRVGVRRELDPGKLAMGLFGAVATVVGVTCLATCKNSTPWSWVGTGIGATVMLAPLGTVY